MKSEEKSMDLTEFLHYMDAGDAGAEHVILSMFDVDQPTKMLNTLNKLDQKGIRGKKICDLYHESGEDITKLFERVKWL